MRGYKCLRADRFVMGQFFTYSSVVSVFLGTGHIQRRLSRAYISGSLAGSVLARPLHDSCMERSLKLDSGHICTILDIVI